MPLVRHQDPGAALALDDLARLHVADRALEEAAEDRVEEAAQQAGEGEAPHERAPAGGGPPRALCVRGGFGAGLAEGEGDHGGGDEEEAAEGAGGEAGGRDAAVGAAGDGAEGGARDEAGWGGGEDAELGAEGVGRHCGVVGYEAQGEEVALPGVAAGRGGGAALELVGMQEDEEGGDEGVGEDLDVGSWALAAGSAAAGGEGYFFLYLVVYLGLGG